MQRLQLASDMMCNIEPPSTEVGTVDDQIHVGFFDNSARPNINSMLRIAAMVNVTSKVQFHAIMLHPRPIPGFSVWPVRLPASVLCVYDGLIMRSSGHGPDYLFKPLLAWMLPPTIRQLILLDCDAVPLRDIRELFAEFERFCPSHVLGLVSEQSNLYPRSLNVRGFNGGVQLHHLERMRSSRPYHLALEQAASARDGRERGWFKAGFLGDQVCLISPYLPSSPHIST